MNIKCVPADSNQAISNPGMDLAECIFDLPTSVLWAQHPSAAASCYAK